MLDCIKVGGKIYSRAEFKALILSEGMGVLGAPTTTSGEHIMNRYDLSSKEDSLVEQWAKLEYEKKHGEALPEGKMLSKSEVDELIYPAGQLTDYNTQVKIRENTSAGRGIVGIAANSGKSAGYAFEAEPITHFNYAGEPYEAGSSEAKALLDSKNMTSIEELIAKDTRAEATERSAPVLNSTLHFTIDNAKFDRLSRTEKDLKTGIDSVVDTHVVNTFETGDTIINLSIDNAKEQKLHVLGISLFNANAYLGMVYQGVPLAAISRIFRTPTLVDLSSKRRLSKETINDAIEQASKELGQMLGVQPSEIPITKHISTALLDKIYTGKHTREEQLRSDLAVLHILKDLVPLGDQLFAYARIFSLLRDMPNKKWQMDMITDLVHRYSAFTDEGKKAKEYEDNYEDFLKDNFRASKQYTDEKSLFGEDRAEKLLKEQLSEARKYRRILNAAPNEYNRANFVNRVLRGIVSKKTAPTDTSVFKTNNVMNLPHVYAAFRSLEQLKQIIEKAFPVHNPIVREFIKKIISESNMFTSYTIYEKMETVSNEFVKFLASNLEFKLDGENFNLAIPEAEATYITNEAVYHGPEAWSQKLINDVSVAQSHNKENLFLKHVEVILDSRTRLRRLAITADKVNDEELVELMRDDFRKLFSSGMADDMVEGTKRTYRDLARDIFKYTLVSQGMFFGRTSFALMFPDEWSISYSHALESRIDNIIVPHSQELTQTNFELLKDMFMYQLLRNNGSLVGYIQGAYPQKIGQWKNARGRNVFLYAGEEVYNEQPIYFDLKYQGMKYDEASSKKFITRYGSDIYALLRTPGSPHTYYRKITENVNHKFYSFTEEDLSKAFNLDKLLTPSVRIVSTSTTAANKVWSFKNYEEYSAGDHIAVVDLSTANPKILTNYEVTGLQKTENTYSGEKKIYGMKQLSTESMDKSEWAKEMKASVAKFLGQSVYNSFRSPSATQAIAQAANTENGLAIVSTSETRRQDGVHSLPIHDIDPQEGAAFLSQYENNVMEAISSIPLERTYFISSGVLSALTEHEETIPMATRIAKRLFEKISYRDPILDTPISKTVEMGRTVEAKNKYRDLITVTLDTNTGKNSFAPLVETEGPHKGSLMDDYSKLTKNQQRKVSEGKLVDFGTVNGVQAFGYIRAIDREASKIYFTMFGDDVYQHLNNHHYDSEIFDSILDDLNRC